MLRRVYEWILRQAGHEHAIWTLSAVSFAEASFFPLPPDLLLVPMILARRDRAMLYAAITTITSVLGGLLGYAIGYYLFELVGHFIVTHLSSQASYDYLQEEFATYGAWVIIGKGVTPIPFKLVTILSGALHYDLPNFVAAAIVCRAIRFFPIALAVYYFGERARTFIETRLALVTSVTVFAIIAGFILLKVL